MRKILFYLLISMFVVSCSEKYETLKQSGHNSYAASTESYEDATKTVLGENNTVLWSEGDCIGVFESSTIATKFIVSEASAGSTNGSFTVVGSQGNGYVSGTEIPNNIAIYPYEENLVCNVGAMSGEYVDSYTVSNVTFPTELEYVAGSFANNSFVMAAVTRTATDNQLRFKNVCGVMRLQLRGTAQVASVRLEGKSGEKLAGNGTLTIYTDERVPAVTMSGDAETYVMLNCGSGVQLDESVATDFYISIPPVSFANGFKVTITDTEGATATIETDKSNTVERSRILKMPVKDVEFNSVITYKAPYKLEFSPEAGSWQKEIFEHSFNSETREGKIIFDGRITEIPVGVFLNGRNTNAISMINIPEGVTIIRSAAFNNCLIGNITFPSTLKTIEGYAFAKSIFMNNPEIVLPEGLETIGEYAFYESVGSPYSIGKLVIPSSVTSIGTQAFANRTINELTIKCNEISAGLFYGSTLDHVISYAKVMSGILQVSDINYLHIQNSDKISLHLGWIVNTGFTYLICPPPTITGVGSISDDTWRNSIFQKMGVSSTYKDLYNDKVESNYPWNLKDW